MADTSPSSVQNFSAPTTPGKQTHRTAYCCQLCKVITRYVTAEEAEELAVMLERFAADVASRRYCPGLNDAAYDLFARFSLQAGSAK